MNAPSPYAESLARIPVTEARVTVLGSDTHYWTYGDADAATTVLLVHGYRGEHHGLEPVVAQLPGVRFIAPDLPAFGESSPLREGRHDIEGYARWLAAFVDALDLASPPVVLGHSFGSIVAAAAVSAGLETPALILVNPIAISARRGPRAFATALTVGFYRAARFLPERGAHAFLGAPPIVRGMSITLAKTKDRALRAWIHSQHATYFSRFHSKRTILEGFEASVSRSVGEYAAGIRVPTLLVAAERDDITPLSAVRALRASLADAELVVIPGVGHLIHYETPGEAASAITAFLSRRLEQ
ncbi:alpha/beta hydrolase [Salinibacterium sp. SYSU T00001]|uniref:alpha/beta fold hydrolase n=1 Tax=Homoserinimonas sedimenticola TaxID=2986805 RepID=UPI002236063F|nr:alpha/beta hydrolase [Salinibacterium sedimenticola]MCW4384427.1 alpha/beta hydrolase [Salinibacterium sedimenticola]